MAYEKNIDCAYVDSVDEGQSFNAAQTWMNAKVKLLRR